MRRRKFIPALLLIASAAAPLFAQPAEVRLVPVELSNFKFTPAQIVLEHDRTYRLRLTDTASGGHDFAAAEFFAASRISPEDRSKIDHGKVKLHGGETVEITMTPMKPGTYKLRCTHFMHSAFGMRGNITVE